VPEKLLYCASSEFESARSVKTLPKDHRSHRLHGHSFMATIRAELPSGWAAFPGFEITRLRSEVSRATELLNYRCLNDFVDVPTDENLARWIKIQVDVPSIQSIGIQSTQNEGVNLLSDGHVHIWRRYVVESAHRLPNVHEGHKCGRMHGHSFAIVLHAKQQLGNADMGIDYDQIDRCWEPIKSQMHFACLNDIPGLENPTSEMISSWIWDQLKPKLAALSWVSVYETASCGAHFDGTTYRIWKDMSFDSAVRVIEAPTGNPMGRVHGHTYTIRLNLSAPLDRVMGWTVDFGDVKQLFNPVFSKLDHHPLHELPGLSNGDAESIVRWIRDQAVPVIPSLNRIDLYETPGCGVIFDWGDEIPSLAI